MSSDDNSKSDLIREFEEFQRKLEAAARLTRSDFAKEARRIYSIAFFPYASKALNAEAEENHVLSVPDAEDPRSRKSITGSTQRERIEGALWYYLEALLARMSPRIQERFEPVAEIARRSSSASLLSSNLLFQEALHSAPHYITTDRIESQDPLRALCDFWGHPDLTASFNERFRLLFAEEWERLVCEAELDAPSQLSPQTPTFHDDARSRVQPSEAAGAVDQMTQQIGDRVVSRQLPQARSRSRLKPSRQFHPSKELIAKIKSMHPGILAKDIVVEMDRLMESMTPSQRDRCAPPESWCKASDGQRTWKELFGNRATHKNVKNRINKVRPLPSEISKKAN